MSEDPVLPAQFEKEMSEKKPDAPIRKMNRKEKRRAGMKARMPWSEQVDSHLRLLTHFKYTKKKEGIDTNEKT